MYSQIAPANSPTPQLSREELIEALAEWYATLIEARASWTPAASSFRFTRAGSRIVKESENRASVSLSATAISTRLSRSVSTGSRSYSVCVPSKPAKICSVW